MVATPGQLHQALFGEGGAAAALRPGQPLVIMSSVGVDAVRAIEHTLSGTGVLLVDAPVTGRRGSRCHWRADRVGRREPSSVGRRAAGAAADGEHALRTAARMSATGRRSSSSTSCSARCTWPWQRGAQLRLRARPGPRGGVARDRTGAASSFMLSDRGPRMLAADEPPVLSAIDIFVKDTSLVVEAAEAKRLTHRSPACAAEQVATAQSRGWGRRDDSTIIGLYTQAQWHSRNPPSNRPPRA